MNKLRRFLYKDLIYGLFILGYYFKKIPGKARGKRNSEEDIKKGLRKRERGGLARKM